MSRVGQLPVEIPSGVDVTIDGRDVVVRGSLGELSMRLTDAVEVSRENGSIRVAPVDQSRRARAMWGTTRALLNNLVSGVSRGFEKRLLITGVGYRAQLRDGALVLQLGYSHEIRYPFPEDITIEAPTQTENRHQGRRPTAGRPSGFRDPGLSAA